MVNHIKEWINSIKESVDISKIALIIVGNKCDLTTQEITVDEEKKKNFEDTRKLKIIEASAKKNINVNDSFIVLIDKMLALGLGKKKTNGIDDDGNQKLQSNNNDKKKSNCCGGGEKRNKNN